MSSTNSKSEPRGSGLTRILQSANCPWPPVCFLWRPCASAARVIVSRYGTFGGWRMTSTFDFRFMRATAISTWSWPAPERRSSLVSASRWNFRDGSSSVSLASAMEILSSSPLDFGSMEKEIAGSGIATAGKRYGFSLAESVSPVRVSLSLAMTPMSPAGTSGTVIICLPSGEKTGPNRSATSRFAFQ